MSKFWKFVALFILLCVLPLGAFAQQQEEDKKNPLPARFGAYNEKELDLEVKVSTGAISIYRIWEGDKKRWRINPQHTDLGLSDEKTEEEAYGELLSKEIKRGLTTYKYLDSFAFGRVDTSGGGGGSGQQNDSNSLSSITVARLQTENIKICQESFELSNSEMAYANSEGLKWVNKIGRSWSQYSRDGQFMAWGVGNFQVGQALYDVQQKIRAYSDDNDDEVISFERDGQGRVNLIRDYTGQQVSYTYDAQGQLETVTDPEGIVTRYVYTPKGDIFKKIVGDDSGAPAEEAAGEKVTYTLTYNDGGQIASVLDDEGNGDTYNYQYDTRNKLFTEVTRSTDGPDVSKVVHVERGIKQVEVDGEPFFKVLRICEDSVIVDRHNRETYFDRDRIGRLKKILFPDGSVVTFEHTLQDWPQPDKPWSEPGKPWGIKRLVTANGVTVDYIRDPQGNILEATEQLPAGQIRRWTFAYDTKGRKIRERLRVDPNQDNDLEDLIKAWTYDVRGRIETFTDAAGHVWTYEYNSRGDVTKITEPNGAIWNFSYTSSGNLKYRRTPQGFQSFWDYNKRGLLKSYREIYAPGEEGVTRFIYNRLGLVKKMIDPQGGEWLYEYDKAGNLKSTTDPEGQQKFWTYKRDGRPKTFTDGSGVTVNINYFDTALPGEAPQYGQPFGPIVRLSYPTYTEELNYDLQDRLIARKVIPTNPEPGVSTIITRYEYDAEGRIKKIIDPEGKEAIYQYDSLGRVVSQTRAGWGTSTTSYSLDQRTITYTDPLGNSVVHTFDRLGKLLTEKRSDNTLTTFTYDNVGNVQSFLNSNNKLHWFTYDLEGRITKHEIYPGGVHTGAPAKTILYDYNLRGDLVSYSDGTTSTTNTLDGLGRPLTTSINFGPFSKSHSYTYYRNGLPNTFTAPDGAAYQYLWDGANRLQAITLPGEGNITYGYDPLHLEQPASITYPGGAKREFTYDSLRRLTRTISKDPASNPLLDYKYSFQDSVLINKNETEHGVYNYSYDDGRRVTSIDNPTSSPENYSYDNLGNRYSSGGIWTYDKNGAVSAADGVTFEYDAQGNRIRRVSGSGTVEFIYDEEDRLIRIESPAGTVLGSYGYDPAGFRVWKEVGGVRTYFYHTSEGLSAEFDSSGNLIRSYLYEPESYFGTSPLALKSGGAGGSYNYFHTDRLGTPQKLTARNGNTTWAAHYTAFGAATVNIEGVSNPLRLAGQYYDAESGLHQNLMRMYDPGLGAYLEQDPYGTLTGPNRYAFAGGNPVMLTDPTGEIIPVVIVYGVLWLGFEAISGFPTIKCFDLLFQTCFFNSSMSDCIEAGTNALLGVGVGWAFKGLRLLAPAAGWALKFGRGFIDPVLPNLRRGTGLLDDLYKALPENEVGERLRGLLGRTGPRPGDYSPDFIVSPGGDAFPVRGAFGPRPNINPSGKRTGTTFIGGSGGKNGDVASVRIMNSNKKNPGGYIKYENSSGQGVDPYSGRTLPNNLSHLPIK